MKIGKILALLCGLVLVVNTHAAEKLRYVILIDNGKQIGEQVVTRGDDGITRVHFIYKNNGRGPELDEQIRYAADGTFSDYRVTGSTTFGSQVDEYFSRKNSRALWRSASEKGSKTVIGSALYVPLRGSYEFASASITALAKRADNKLPLLPFGTLTQRKLDEVEISQDGKTQRVQLLVQTGLDLSPSFYWATTGSQPRLFAATTYFFLIEDGWQSNRVLLENRQKQAEAEVLKEYVARLEHPLPGLTVIRNARVFDSENAKLGEAADVYVLRGKITAVLPSGSPVRGADNEIDAAGRVLLPGLFDMHGHLWQRWVGLPYLAAGITSARDLGNDNAKLQQIMGEVVDGNLIMPQIIPAGFIEGESQYSLRVGFVIKNLMEAKDAVDWYVEHGYPQLKIYNSFPRELVPEIVAYAHDRGMRVSGHVPAFMRAQEVVEQGYDEIQHINQVLLNFLVTPTTDTRTLERFYLPAEKVAGLDFDSKPVQDFISLLQAHHTVIDPTLSTFAFIQQRDGELSQFTSVVDHLPPDMQRNARTATMKIPSAATHQRYKKSYAKMIEFVGRMYRAGIPIVAGTDETTAPGFVLQHELELYVQAGLTPAQVLQIATWNGAKYTRTLDQRGSIAPGKLADLVLVDGDPTVNIADIRKVAMVITQGKWIAPAEIYDSVGIKPFVTTIPVVKSLTQH